MGIQRYKLEGRGPARVLGELEAAIMEAVWRLGTPTGAEVCAAIGPDANYKTVATVANRLVEKGHLERQRTAGRAFRYRAREDRDAFLQRVSVSVADGLVRDFGHQALARFVEAADTVDPTYLDELERLVRARKEQR